MDTFTVRDLREHTGTLIQDAEEGRLSLITKRGRPVFLAVPFSEELIQEGLPTLLGVHLYKEGVLSLEKAAKLSKLSVELFIEKLGKLGVNVVNYSTDELEEELKTFKTKVKKKEK